jgi:hypothetical protein
MSLIIQPERSGWLRVGQIGFTGHNLVSGPAIDGILLMTGSHTFVGSSLEDPDATLTESHGKVLNVCDVLAP